MSTPTIPAAPAAAAPASAGAQATEVAAGDFLLMLGQLLGAPVAQTGGKSAAPAAATETDVDTETAAQDAAAITGVPVPVVTLPVTQPPQGQGADAGIAAVATSTPKASSAAADATLAKTLLDAANGVDTQQTDAATTGSQQPHLSSDVSQQLRITAAPDPGPTRTLHSTVGSSQWADELSTRMMLMSERGQHSASLRLNPEHLGPLEVRIAVRDDQASVWFGSAHADTRAAIEQALPRLRELFASQGLSLADAGVHHDAPREQSRQSSTGAMNDPLGGGSETEVTSVQIASRLGLVDEYV
ncbi:MAG TPA: flagellar hook-length control protein FliK [Povalibacter sp.]|uniref:flagellar hook-length control protein FliK n=1 Tax=Povalibacter sp. TaxID=1962978 RepID=UPI002C38AA7D|nr:flagellar hook-length control protein FliK [Povalibacter sp.]HMN44426.1 flagellar hook-length control protein FliK [Povalibacter sp.]